MRYKIYFGDHPLYLTDTLDQDMQEIMHHDDGVYMDELSNAGVNSMIHEMKQPQRHAGVFFHADVEALFKAFARHFKRVDAAGGLVTNDQQDILMIFRRGKWDLPKGKLDPGETIEACAVREVLEETGISQVTLDAPLLTTYHTYDEYGKHILKASHWYLMHAPLREDLVPQTSEDITHAEWVSPERARTLFSTAFPSVVDVLKTHLG